MKALGLFAPTHWFLQNTMGATRRHLVSHQFSPLGSRRGQQSRGSSSPNMPSILGSFSSWSSPWGPAGSPSWCLLWQIKQGWALEHQPTIISPVSQLAVHPWHGLGICPSTGAGFGSRHGAENCRRCPGSPGPRFFGALELQLELKAAGCADLFWSWTEAFSLSW